MLKLAFILSSAFYLLGCQQAARENNDLRDVTSFNRRAHMKNANKLPPGINSGLGMKLFGEHGAPISNLIYSGLPINCFVYLLNANPFPDKVRLMLFLDVAAQSFSVDGNNENISYALDIPARSSIAIPITFSPKIRIFSEDHTLWFTIFTRTNEKSDPNRSRFFPITAFPCKLVIQDQRCAVANVRSPNLEETTFVVRKDLLKYRGFRLAIGVGREVRDLFQALRFNVKRGGKITFRMEAIAEPGTYSTIIFLDNNPVSVFNGEDFLVWEVENSEMLSREFTISAPDKKGEYEVCSITLPLGVGQTYLRRSPGFILEVNN